MAGGSDKFAIVAFPEEDHSLAIIHKTWLVESTETTFWPKEKNPNKRRRMTIEGVKPQDSWMQVKCLIKDWADTYEKALEKLQALEYTSDFTSEEELGRGKRKRRPTFPFDYDDSTDTTGSDDEYEPPKPPTPPQPRKKTGANFSKSPLHHSALYETVTSQATSQARAQSSRMQPQYIGLDNVQLVHASHTNRMMSSPSIQPTGDDLGPPVHTPYANILPHSSIQPTGVHSVPPVHTLYRSRTPHSSIRPAGANDVPLAAATLWQQHHDAPVTPMNMSHPGTGRVNTDAQVPVFMERILLALNSIKVTQQTHSEYFSLLLRNTEDAPLDPEGLPDLPFSTVQDFVHFDKELEVDKRARLRMRQHMLVQGGDTPKERTTRILRSILSSSVAAEYSWCGAKGKHKFSDLNICKLLCSTLTYRQNLEEAKATKKDIEKAGMSWLRHAAERAAAEKKSMGRKDGTPFTLD